MQFDDATTWDEGTVQNVASSLLYRLEGDECSFLPGHMPGRGLSYSGAREYVLTHESFLKAELRPYLSVHDVPTQREKEVLLWKLSSQFGVDNPHVNAVVKTKKAMGPPGRLMELLHASAVFQVDAMAPAAVQAPPPVLEAATEYYKLARQTGMAELWPHLDREAKEVVWISHYTAFVFLEKAKVINHALDRARCFELRESFERCSHRAHAHDDGESRTRTEPLTTESLLFLFCFSCVLCVVRVSLTCAQARVGQ